MVKQTFKTMKLLLILALGFLTGCMTGHCPPKGSKKVPEATKSWVYKYDQSKQCQKTEGLSLESMSKELSELKIFIFESKKKYDGLMRVQVCGAYTGQANLYLINSTDLDKAQANGFQLWDF